MSFSCFCPDTSGPGEAETEAKNSVVLSCARSDLSGCFEPEQACGWFGLRLACECHELASPATAFVFLPHFIVFLFLCLCLRRPVALVYVILSTLPCFAFLIASSEVQHTVSPMPV